ncbi:hypothetical protein [Nocardia vulneris]|uniref:hypothetical protein n=1 Tax=Nocardia vulneris TaxID=1141657 RepID=UPI000690F928|nr:hypothetical protein [Nocardia vulneris]
MIAFNDARCYSQGMELHFSVHARLPELVSALGAFSSHFVAADESILIGTEFADGRTATTLSNSADQDAQTPMLTHGHSGGGPEYSSASYFLTPVPPAGPFSIIVCWPAAGIRECRIDLDSEPFLAAVRRAQVLWPRQPPSTWQPPRPTVPDLEPDGWFARVLA